MLLRRQIRRRQLAVREVNIWEDAAAAARVRQITGGDETVPTVTVGEKALVNPSIAELITVLRDSARLSRTRRSLRPPGENAKYPALSPAPLPGTAR